MQTLKTAVVVVLLLVVFYGVYEMLNRPPDEPPRAVVEAQMQGMSLDVPDIGLGDVVEDGDLVTMPPTTAPDASQDVLNSARPDSYGAPAPPSSVAPDAEASFPGGAATQGGIPSPPGVPLPDESGYPPAGTAPPPSNSLGAPPLAHAAASNAPTATAPITGSFVPGNGGVQNNPFVNEEVVTRPGDRGANGAQPTTGSQVYHRALKMAKAQLANGEYHAALSSLSVWYKSQELTADEQRELVDLLDPLAGRVIYSREHITELPYKVRRNERLEDIAAQYNVPWQLLQKINGIENPDVLLPGSELKVLRGPFEAEVDLGTRELTVFLDGMYAGRFPIALGQDPQPIDGDFQVRDKQLDKAYFANDGRMIPADNPSNPFGGVFLDLGREVCIHGSPHGGAEQNRGCISLSPRDADDVYSILSVGSRVRILR